MSAPRFCTILDVRRGVLEQEMQAAGLIRSALERGQLALSEYQSKKLLTLYGIPVTREKLSNSAEEAISAAVELGFPVVLKA